MSDTREYTLMLKSHPANISQIEPFLNECRCSANFGEETYQDVLLALTEAVTNSIHHGNRKDPEKNVMINLRSDEGQIHCCVQDEGRGFNPDAVPDCTHPDRIMQPNGRGVHIIRCVADEVNYSDEGRRLEFRFRY